MKKTLTFDSVAEDYQLIRPGYPDELYQALFSFCPVDDHSFVAEIGIGSGQASLPVLKTGCHLIAIEPGENFARMCRSSFREYPGFSLINCRFEEAELAEEAFDLVYAASSFHWVDEKTGYEKVYGMLKSGGAFARFANHPLPAVNDSELAEEIQELYLKYYYPYVSREPAAPRSFADRQAAETAQKAVSYGFTDIRHQLFKRARRLTADQYVQLMGTYSDHLSLPQPVRREFFLQIEQAINEHGGFISVGDTIDLELARKP